MADSKQTPAAKQASAGNQAPADGPAAETATTPPAEVAGPPPVSVDDVKRAVRDALEELAVEHALRDDEQDDTTTEQDVPAPLVKRTIQHNLFAYDLPEGGNAIGMRGDTVELMPHDLERGERFGAFTAIPGQLPEPGGSVLPAFPVDGDSVDAEQDAWVKAGTVEEIVAAAGAAPETVASIIAAEERRGPAARKTLLHALATMEVTA